MSFDLYALDADEQPAKAGPEFHCANRSMGALTDVLVAMNALRVGPADISNPVMSLEDFDHNFHHVAPAYVQGTVSAIDSYPGDVSALLEDRYSLEGWLRLVEVFRAASSFGLAVY